jgi:quinol monooxygenase YgiN
MSSETIPIIIHGSRRIKESMEQKFKECYEAYAKSAYEENPGIKVVFAFPDPGDPLVYYHVLWCRDAATFAHDSARPPMTAELWTTYQSTPEDQDTLDVYGGWNDDVIEILKQTQSVHYDFHKSLAGFIKQDGAGQQGPAMLGFFMRSVKPGQIENLAELFQKVCEIWYAKAPGILCATVSRDPNNPNVVHDLRLFANYASYQAHVDKSNQELTDAMESWFANYDTKVPMTGELYAENTKQEGMQTSSMEKSPKPRSAFNEFNFGMGMLGPMPNMIKNDP